MSPALLLFLLLQLGDLGTTMLFLGRGVAEANPVVAGALGAFQHPAASLLLVKLAACGLGWVAWKSGRYRLLRRANVFFALCVLWNGAALALA